MSFTINYVSDEVMDMAMFHERLTELFDDMKDENPNLSRKDFAAKCQVKESQMHNYLNGVNNPPLETLLSIAKKCGTNVSWLVGESDIKYTPNVEIEMLCRDLNKRQTESVKQFIRFLQYDAQQRNK